jgi:hypothetical protein
MPNSSKSELNLRQVWCDRCGALRPKGQEHKHTKPAAPAREKKPCVFHTYPPGSSRCRACGHIAGD